MMLLANGECRVFVLVLESERRETGRETDDDWLKGSGFCLAECFDWTAGHNRGFAPEAPLVTRTAGGPLSLFGSV